MTFLERKPEDQRHVHYNKVTYVVRNRQAVPAKVEGKKQIYVVYVELDGKMEPIGVGETTHVPTRISGGYAWCIKTMKPDGSTIIRWMQEEAIRRGNKLHFEVDFIEQVDARQARTAESQHINSLIAMGYKHIKNRTR